PSRAGSRSAARAGTDIIWRVTACRSLSPAVPTSLTGRSSRRATWRAKYSAPMPRFSSPRKRKAPRPLRSYAGISSTLKATSSCLIRPPMPGRSAVHRGSGSRRSKDITVSQINPWGRIPARRITGRIGILPHRGGNHFLAQVKRQLVPPVSRNGPHAEFLPVPERQPLELDFPTAVPLSDLPDRHGGLVRDYDPPHVGPGVVDHPPPHHPAS